MDWTKTTAARAYPQACLCLSALLFDSGSAFAGQVNLGAVPAVPQAPQTISLQQAVADAEHNEPLLAAARADARIASLDKGNARAALLPSIVYHNQALYTQPNGVGNSAGEIGSQPAPIFIANNAVREYASQAVVTETLSVAGLAAVHAADAAAARAAADLEVQRRGLVATTANLYFGVASAERRLQILQSAKDEADSFVTLTQQREVAREAAHADVVKAELTAQQRARDVIDAQLATDRARLELGVLLFPDPRTPFTLDTSSAPRELPPMADIQAEAGHHNPALESALASLRQSNAEVTGAKAAYLPDLGLNFNYGIDASNFATKGPFDSSNDPPRNPRNLGYSMSATLDIPVWDWLSTARRVKQTEARRDAATVALTATQRRLIADLQEVYGEAQVAFTQLGSLALSVTTAQDSLRMTRLRYTSGEATVLEVVDAETTLTSAQTAQEDGQVRYGQALSSVQILTGTLR